MYFETETHDVPYFKKIAKPGMIVSRRMSYVKFLQHFGIVCWDTKYIYEFRTKSQHLDRGLAVTGDGSVYKVSIDEFMENKDKITIYENDYVTQEENFSRVLLILEYIYRNEKTIPFQIWGNNCESFIYGLFYGSGYSPQGRRCIVITTILLILLALFLLYILRPKD